ncbi:roadblock/LC7 domain-containing protein [Actinokineospora sp. 24-640]
MSTSPSRQVNEFGWLVSNFADRVPGVAHAVVISVDGLLLTSSDQLQRERAEQIAAISAGVNSLTEGASRCFGGDRVLRTIIEMDGGILLLLSIQDGSCLTVLAETSCDVGQVAYEMNVLVDQVGQLLTPELRAELRGARQAAAAHSG